MSIEGYALSPEQKRSFRRQKNEGWLVTWGLLHLSEADGREIDASRVEDAVRRFCAEHEILRARLIHVPALAFPLQAVGDARDVVDWAVERGGEDVARARVPVEAAALRDELAAGGPPAVRARLFVGGPTSAYLWVGAPSLFCDESSWALLASAIGAEPHGRAPAGVEYIDFAQWHADLLAGPRPAEASDALAFWGDGRLSRTAVDIERGPRGGGGSGAAGARGRIGASARCARELLRLASALAVAPGAVIATAWAAALMRLYGGTELVLGYRFDGRREEGLADSVGPLDAALPFLVACDPTASFESVARQVGSTVARATSYRSWAWAVDAVTDQVPAIGLSCFVRGAPVGAAAGAGVVATGGAPAGALLDLRAWGEGEGEGAVDLSLEFDRARVSDDEARAVLASLTVLLEHAVIAPETTLASLRLVTVAELERLLASSDPSPRPSTTLHAAFRACAARMPHALAVAYGNETLRYGEIDERSDRLARRLMELGLRSEEPVVLCAARSVALLEAVFGILKAGGAFVSVDVDDPEKRRARLATDVGARFVLADAERAPAFERAGLRVIVPEANGAWADPSAPATPPEDLATPDSLAYVMYTSGSTGEPKGVAIEHRSTINLLFALRKAIYDAHFPGRLAGVRVAANAPFSFDASIKQLVLLLQGASLHVVPAAVRADGPAFLRVLREQEIDVLDCTPSQLKLLLQAGLADAGHASPRVVLVGGEAVDEDLWRVLAGDGGRAYYNVYGPTECTVDTTIARITPGETPHIGRPIENARVRLLDRFGGLVRPGFVGEICIGGDGLAREYIHNPRATGEAFVTWTAPVAGAAPERLYRSGDLARQRQDGTFEFVGRIDDQVKIRGVRIEPEEIARVAKTHPGVQDAVVVARASDQQLVCYVVARGERGEEVGGGAAVREFLREHLPQAMIPTHILFVDAIPLTENGKLDRSRLPSTERQRPELAPFCAPESEIERTVADIWRSVLNLERIGIRDNFFDVGGHSLLLPQVQLNIQRRLGLTISLPQLLEFPTIEAIARHFQADAAAAPPTDDARGDKQREARVRLAQRGRRP